MSLIVIAVAVTCDQCLLCAPVTLMNKIVSTLPDLGSQMENFLATGNLRSRSGLALQQVISVGGRLERLDLMFGRE